MIFNRMKLEGAYIIELERFTDERGYFARTWCQREFEDHGLNPGLVQCNISYSRKKSTLRGMHYQVAPYEEAKLVSCIKGSIYDVIIDLRKDSKTYMLHEAVKLNAEDHSMIYIPEGFAHGFQTLLDHTEVYYQMSEFFAPEAARGLRWNDPVFGIKWPPSDNRILSEKDRNWPDYRR